MSARIGLPEHHDPVETFDLKTLASRFDACGRLQMPDFLIHERAAQLRDELVASTRWRHVISGASQPYEIASSQLDAMPAVTREALNSALHAEATTGFRYQYDVIRVPDDLPGDVRPRDRLEAFARYMNSRGVIADLRRITKLDSIMFADVQATRYRTGDFLTRHDDEAAGRKRLCAYVLSLTEGWSSDWGGLLQFTDPDGLVTQTIVPLFNSITLFAVPQPHSVSYVAPYAGRSRISVTGWLRAA